MELESAERSIRSSIDTLDNDITIPKQNKDAAHKFYNFMRAKGSSPKTIAKDLYCFRKFLAALPKGVTVENATRDDIETVMANIEALELAQKTKHNIKVCVKSFYKHYKGEDITYPKLVACCYLLCPP